MDNGTSNVILNSLGIPMEYVLFGIAIFSIILFIIVLVQQIKIHKITKKYKLFIAGKDGSDLESVILERFAQLESLKKSMDILQEQTGELRDKFNEAYSKVGIVKYDAFKEMGGNLSFSLALLNDKNDGFIMNSMHSRESCYTYIKEIVKGESYILLAEEEKEALSIAVNMRNYML